MLEQSGIYAIAHIETGREYVGQAINFRRRWLTHQRQLRAGKHKNPHLQAAWDKYGEQAFRFAIIELCNPDRLNAREQAAFDERKPEFNLCRMAGSRYGVPHTPESKAKLSKANKGRNRSPETCAAISAGLQGLRASETAKAKMRAAKLGKKMSAEAIANMAAAQRARARPSSEYDSRRGRKRDPEAIAKSAAARTGAKRTDEQRARMREAAARVSPEKRAAIAQARRDAIARRKTIKP